MKRFLLTGVMLLAVECAAYCYTNDAIVLVPTMNPELIQLDDPVFVNNGTFSVSIPQFLAAPSVNYETSDTLTYLNTGTLNAIPGFDFENFPSSVGKAHWADTFINRANGLNGGVISAINIFGGLNQWAGGATTIGGIPLNYETSGLATVIVRATNIVNNGLITMDSTGLIDLMGKEVNLDHAVFQMTGAGGNNLLDSGAGGFNTNTAIWQINGNFAPTFAQSPIYTNSAGLEEEMSLGNATSYFESLAPAPGADGIIVWRIIFLQDNSPTNVTTSVSFGNQGFAAGSFHIQWTGIYRDPLTGNTSTNYFGMSDEPADRRGPFYFDPLFFINALPEFDFLQSTNPIFLAQTAPGFVPDPFAVPSVTNDFGYISIQPTATSVGTNQVVGGSPTNLPGRIQLTSSNTLNLVSTHIIGGNYLTLNAPNFLGNTNSIIEMPYSSLNLGVAGGSLILSNLLDQALPGYTGVAGAPSAVLGFGSPMGGIQAFSGSYRFVDVNNVTNDVRILMVNSALQPTFGAVQEDVALHSTHDLTIADELNIDNSFTSDTASLTLSTNANSSYSLQGIVNLKNQNIFWSAALPNLQYLTNWGTISTPNLINFAGNMNSPFSPRAGATPYQAFVNHGNIQNGGIFVKANYFEDSGTISEAPVGNIDLAIDGLTTITNATMTTLNGGISIAGGSILVSNSVITAGRTLSFSPSCFLSDGYALTNQFGHITNGTLPLTVTNGNTFQTSGGIQVLTTPASGDLLGTTVINGSSNSLESINVWPGEDRGVSPKGFAENSALGRMILVTDGNPSHFTFSPATGNNALYVDTIEFRGGATNTDGNGNFTSIGIQPGMKIYFAQAIMNGVSIAEKLNGKNGGGFLWVSNYAGLFSSTNLLYPDGNTYVFNEALAISPNFDSDNDGTVNRDDPTPIPAGTTFDITNAGPIACDGGVNPPPQDPNPTQEGKRTPGILDFPVQQQAGGAGSGTGSVSFAVAQGNYNGLFYETNGVNPLHAGSFTAKLTGKGAFSGKLQLGAGSYSFAGSFDQTGNSTVTLKNKKLATLTLTLQLVNNDEITGTVSGADWTAELLAFVAANNASTFGAGKHSVVLSPDADASTTPDAGDSYGTMTLNKNGNIQWGGVLSDGSKVSEKSVLSKDGVWPLYSSLYNGNGSLIGWLQVTNGSSNIGGSVIWVVPASQNGLYQNGLTNQLDATGASVTSSAGAAQKTIILSGPQLSAPLTNNVTISGKNGQSGNNSVTLSVDAKNGLFSGSVVDPNSGQKLSFQGALLENNGIGGGFFLNPGKDQGGKVSLAPAN